MAPWLVVQCLGAAVPEKVDVAGAVTVPGVYVCLVSRAAVALCLHACALVLFVAPVLCCLCICEFIWL